MKGQIYVYQCRHGTTEDGRQTSQRSVANYVGRLKIKNISQYGVQEIKWEPSELQTYIPLRGKGLSRLCTRTITSWEHLTLSTLVTLVNAFIGLLTHY